MHLLPSNGPRWSRRSRSCRRLAGHGKVSVQGSVETGDSKVWVLTVSDAHLDSFVHCP